MPPAAGPVGHSDRLPVAPMAMPTTAQQAPTLMSDGFAKDAIIAWFRGEFAAANAIIDALCNHLTQLEGGVGSEYESAFAAIHRRRLNWIPILQMQKYFSIADVTLELKNVAANKVEKAKMIVIAKAKEEEEAAAAYAKKIHEMSNSPIKKVKDQEASDEDVSLEEDTKNGDVDVIDEDSVRDGSPVSDITDTGSVEVINKPLLENIEICSNHENCEARRNQIKMTKGYVAKEPVKGHMVNVMRGLKSYDNIFTDTEVSKLYDYVNELRVAGQNGELSGETFVLYNQQMKGNKRELIQLGVPIFGHIKEDETSKCPKSQLEPIPPLLQGVVEHMIQWHLISENRKPNGCIINFFDEGEYSQPFSKPPHLEQPISTLLLSESTMAFGRTLVTDNEGNYKGPLMLSLKQGTLLVMRGNSADIARHVMCASPNKRVSITFFKVRTENGNGISTVPPMTRAMTLWQPGVPNTFSMTNGTYNNGMIPKWGILQPPMVMLAPMNPVVMNPRRLPRGGTGVFLPWAAGPKRPARHLPPRAQKGRVLALPAPVDTTTNTNTNTNDEKGV